MRINFSVGRKYHGLVDGKIYAVKEILEVGWYHTASGGEFFRRSPDVVFLVGEGPETCSVPLSTAERLLLEEVPPVDNS